MDRVTDEWLRKADDKAATLAEKTFPDMERVAEWESAFRLAFAQSIARECREIADAWAGFPDASYRIAKGISARFGLEDE